MASELELIERMRTLRAARNLDGEVEQLLRDAEALLVRAAAVQHPLSAVTTAGPPAAPDDFSDSSFVPGLETQASLIRAALDHSDSTNSTAFLVPIPGTWPPLLIGLGERQVLIELLSTSVAADPI